MTSSTGHPAAGSSYNLVLQIAPGSGIISRKPDAVLFIPRAGDGMEKLLTAFVTAADGHEFDAVADAVIDNDFAVPHFACVQAGQEITLRVFGNIELRTDQRSVPSLIGDHSSTWIDHRIHGHPDAAEIAVSDSQLDEVTDLVLGTVHAGGFNLLVTSTGDQAGPGRTSMATDGLATGNDVPNPQPGDPDFLRYVLEAFVGDGLADAPPPQAQDRLPAELIDEGPSDHLLVGQHSKSRRKALQFDDGTIVPLLTDIVIGRNPDRVAELGHAHPLVVTGDRVSRAHLIVRCRGGEVIVEDCGSRNGSVLVPSADRPPMGLVAAEPIALTPGAAVYFGAKSFTVIELDD